MGGDRAGRLERRAAQLPERLQTRDWPSAAQVTLALGQRLGRAGVGWKIGAASALITRTRVRDWQATDFGRAAPGDTVGADFGPPGAVEARFA